VIINKKNLRNGSCNFCKRGELNKHQNGLDFPYRKVIEIHGDFSGGPSVRFCFDCFKELKKYKF
jgi:hypothetical protein